MKITRITITVREYDDEDTEYSRSLAELSVEAVSPARYLDVLGAALLAAKPSYPFITFPSDDFGERLGRFARSRQARAAPRSSTTPSSLGGAVRECTKCGELCLPSAIRCPECGCKDLINLDYR